jgi:hypothetical protein
MSSIVGLGKKVTVSVAMGILAANAVASVDKKASIAKSDLDVAVSDELSAAIDSALASEGAIEEVSSMLYSLASKIESEETGKSLAEVFFVGDEYQLAAYRQDSRSNTAMSCYSNCYTNCYTDCHSACHGSRGWR